MLGGCEAPTLCMPPACRQFESCYAGIQRFLRAADLDRLFMSVQTSGEIGKGVEIICLRSDLATAKGLDMIAQSYADRILDFDHECARMRGRLMA